MNPAGALLGAGIGAGLFLIAAALAGRLPAAMGLPSRRARLSRRGGLAVAAGAITWLITGWPVGALLAAAGAWWLPPLLGPDQEASGDLARTEAIASWAEMLRDTLAGAAGLEQTILATAPIAPAPIRSEVQLVAVRIRDDRRLADALAELADGLCDPTGDMIVAALTQAGQRQAAHLAPLLSSLAAAAREQVTMRMRIAALRARTRTSTRVVVGATLTLAAAMALMSPEFLQPYDQLEGQLVLAVIGGLFAAAFAWLHSLARIRRPQRFLESTSRPGSEVGAAIGGRS